MNSLSLLKHTFYKPMSTSIIPKFHKTDIITIKSIMTNSREELWSPCKLVQYLFLLNEKVEKSLRNLNRSSIELSECCGVPQSSSNKSNPFCNITWQLSS